MGSNISVIMIETVRSLKKKKRVRDIWGRVLPKG